MILFLLAFMYTLNSSSHSDPLVKAAIVAEIAKAFGSATSSVFKALQILCLKNLFGIITAAVCNPAMLKVFVGAMQVRLIFAQVSETEAKGIYSLSGSVKSQ